MHIFSPFMFWSKCLWITVTLASASIWYLQDNVLTTSLKSHWTNIKEKFCEALCHHQWKPYVPTLRQVIKGGREFLSPGLWNDGHTFCFSKYHWELSRENKISESPQIRNWNRESWRFTGNLPGQCTCILCPERQTSQIGKTNLHDRWQRGSYLPFSIM